MKRILTLLLLTITSILVWSSYPLDEGLFAEHVQADDSETHLLWPVPLIADTIKVPIDFTKPLIREYKVRYGDSFHEILKSLQLPNDRVNTLAYNIGQVFDMKQFQVGNDYKIYYDRKTETPQKLVYNLENRKELQLDLLYTGVSINEKKITIQTKSLNAAIASSLAQTIITKGAPEELADKILSVLAWKIDFDHLQPGDHFEVIYEEESTDGEVIGVRDIKMVAFTHEGITHRGYGFDNGNGVEYFDENGKNLSHAPLQFDLITSLYAQKRFHPVRRSYRAHYGMDFEAEKGTPIEAIKAGIITRAEYGRANGNNVKIKHSEALTTQYLHMVRIDSAIKVGATVAQGQVIGYVGSTGLSSGPHLCLRVWHLGRQRDPLQFDFPRRADVKDSLMETFQNQIATYKDEALTM